MSDMSALRLTGRVMSGEEDVGLSQPRLLSPAGATDCHHHIYDRRWPVDPRASLLLADATVSDYRRLQRRLGISRNVVVQPSTYGTDNRGLLESLAAFGRDARGVAVIGGAVADSELQMMDQAGVRGVRFNLRLPAGAALASLEEVAGRIAPLGWHVQLNISGEQIAELADRLQRLPTPIVFDHLGHIPGEAGTEHPGFRAIARLVSGGRAWVKLTGPYLGSTLGPPYADRGAVAKAFVSLAPERVLWGTDWPHPSERQAPDDALLFDLLGEWASDERDLSRILVDNPMALYGFDPPTAETCSGGHT